MTAAASAINERFKTLLKGEIQNRAFALLSLRPMRSKVSAPDDVAFYTAWVEFEEFNQQRYAPYARKYGFSQEPGWSARARASLANGVAALLSERVVLDFMLKETEKYVLKLQEMASLGPSEDKEFLDYAVKQEILQVDLLKSRIAGDTHEAVRLLTSFLEEHRELG